MATAKKPWEVNEVPYAIDEEKFRGCVARVHTLMHSFKGDLHELEPAIGFMFTGYYYGWKVLHVIHSKKTVRKYEAILGFSIKDLFEAEGPYADKCNGWRAIKKISNFWKVINGEIDAEISAEERSLAK